MYVCIIMYLCMYTESNDHIHADIYTNDHVCMHIYIYIHTYIYICIHFRKHKIYIYICTYLRSCQKKTTDSGLAAFCSLSRRYLPSTSKTTEQLFYYA